MKKVLVIVGPTAVGKTALSIELAKKFNGEIISGDSMQVYRHLDVGTAKVTPEEKAGITHHLIDCRDISENYSAADFQKEGRKCIEMITAEEKLPIVVGGTGLYIQSLLYDLHLGRGANQEETPAIRQFYEQIAQEKGNQALWERLYQKDPAAAKTIHYNNRKRVIRALEVFDQTGHSILQPKEVPQKLYDFMLIGLETERTLLYERINQRVDQMIDEGLLAEAKWLFQTPEVQAAQGIGYKEFFPYFEGNASLATVTAMVKQQSRRYAKRQLTWFKNRMSPQWWDLVQNPETKIELEAQVNHWLIAGKGSKK